MANVFASTILAIVISLLGNGVFAAEIKVLSSVGLKSVIDDLGPQFEQKTGHKLSISYGLTVALKRQIDAGADFDLAVLTPPVIADLLKEGKVDGKAHANIAQGGVGMAVRTGGRKPDLGTVGGFRQTLLDAESITYAAEGPSGAHLLRLIDKLGIADAVKPKLRPTSGSVAAAVAMGEAQYAFQLVSELVNVSGVDLVGSLPKEVQNYVTITGGVGAKSAHAGTALELLGFLRSAAAGSVIRSKGMEPQ